MSHPLYVAFLWHMHQPYYRDASTGDFVLPWTRLHATKDYLHMARVLMDYPSIHATVNLVPSLIEQLEDYASGESTDKALRVSQKEHLSASDKEYLLSFFFNINWDKVINRYPAYRELLRQRQEAQGDWRRFSDQYWTDLIVWFNLAWFDPSYIRSDPMLQALVDKGQGFSRADVSLVAERSRQIAGPTLAAYRRLAQRGQVEICTSPYYHPILPLLIDGRSAREATPDIALPPAVFAYPEDALEQIRRGILAYERLFGQPPKGLWPSEGAVSQAVIELLARHTDLRWTASDEAILARSLGVSIERDAYGHVLAPRVLYQPYSLKTPSRQGGTALAMVFRDRLLSDRIGFVYQHMDGRTAAEDLVNRLRHIHEAIGPDDQPHLASIILDGENCWEYYDNNGDEFLRNLYALLSNDPALKTVTMSEYLDQFAPRQSIGRLAAGSWIGGDMLTWIGEPGQNRAWDYLARTRERLVSRAAQARSTSLDVIGQAWQELYIAEGSDWFWWYSSRNNPNSDVFDAQFRGHLAEVYRNLGYPSPEWLGAPIQISRQVAGGRSPSGYVTPTLAASAQAGHGWAQAGYMEPDYPSATMQRGQIILRRLYYGYDTTHLYLRMELNPVGPVNSAVIYLSRPRGRTNRSAPALPTVHAEAGDGRGWSHELTLNLATHTSQLRQADGYENWLATPTQPDVAFDSTVAEVRLTLADLGVRLGDTLEMVALLEQGGVQERHPLTGALSFRLARLNP